MRIVDAQVHIWSAGVSANVHRKVPSFSAEELLAEMMQAGVDEAVIHPPSWDPNSHLLATAAVQHHPGRFAILGSLPPDRPESRDRIATWRDQPGMCGLRYALTRPHEQEWHRDGTMEWIWPAAEQARLPVALLAGRFLPDLQRIAERHPGLPLLIDHCGLLRSAQDDAAFVHLDTLLGLARLPNVAIKATGAPGYTTEPYPYRNLHDTLHRIFDAFGPRRFFWGTDITRMPCAYRQCVTMFTEELAWLHADDLALVMGQGICDWIGFAPQP